MNVRKPHILLAQNDEFLSDIYKRKFEAFGYKVTLVGNGDACIREIEKKHPDVIVLDVLLPKLDGFSVLEILKQDLKLQSIPVFILTQLGQKEDVQRALELGAVEYIIKAHVKPEELLQKVERFLQT